MRTYTNGGSVAKFEMVTDKEPTGAEVEAQQIKDGYHPIGYGGPWKVHTKQREDGKFITTWESLGSCD